MSERLIQTVEAKDSAGRVHTLDVYQMEIDASSLDTGGGKISGAKRIMYGKLQANRISKGRYKVVALGLELASDDPDAP